jgi:hypothetical protein
VIKAEAAITMAKAALVFRATLNRRWHLQPFRVIVRIRPSTFLLTARAKSIAAVVVCSRHCPCSNERTNKDIAAEAAMKSVDRRDRKNNHA